MVLLIINDPPMDPWVALLGEFIPDLEVRCWPQVGNEDEIEYVFAWEPSLGTLGRFPNLKAVLSVAAGANGILRDTSLAAHIPVIRTLGIDAPALMAEFVLTACLMIARGLPRILADREARRWTTYFDQSRIADQTVGILGLGALGEEAAHKLLRAGFNVEGWSRSGQALPGLTVHSGQVGLFSLVQRSNILVCLLPLTDETRGIIDSRLLSLLPQGAGFVNVGRGEHLDEDALFQVVQSGWLSGAIIDVCRTEPLPPEHVFWTEPRIILTGHNAAIASRRARALSAAQTIRILRAGGYPANVVDRATGY